MKAKTFWSLTISIYTYDTLSHALFFALRSCKAQNAIKRPRLIHLNKPEPLFIYLTPRVISRFNIFPDIVICISNGVNIIVIFISNIVGRLLLTNLTISARGSPVLRFTPILVLNPTTRLFSIFHGPHPIKAHNRDYQDYPYQPVRPFPKRRGES